MWAGILALLKAVPAILAAIKGLLMLWTQIKEGSEKREDEKGIQDEKDSAHNGGRPSST